MNCHLFCQLFVFIKDRKTGISLFIKLANILRLNLTNIMKNIILFLCLLFSQVTFSQEQKFVTSDIDNFWNAYDKIILEEDSLKQVSLLEEHFLNIGSTGLAAFREAKGYTIEDYLHVINAYPKFWSSIRENTHSAKNCALEIEKEVKKLEQLYPDLKPADIYFTMGAMRSPGAALNGHVLIGSEFAFTDKNTISSEFPERLENNLRPFFDNNRIEDVVFLNVHEYVHTQQNTYGYDLLSQTLFEGIAEFVTVISTSQPSQTPAIAYGKTNNNFVQEVFEKQMFNPHWYDWLYNSFENQFKMRDLGYYVGYAIAEKYYKKSIDKKLAIKEMIELDYSNQTAIEIFAEESGYFKKSFKKLHKAYDKSAPKIKKIVQFKNGSQSVSPNTKRVTVEFSAPMDERMRGFDYGPLGETSVLSVQKYIGFSEDGKSMTFEVKLEPNKQYQLLLSDSFRSKDGVLIKPYLIDIKTADK